MSDYTSAFKKARVIKVDYYCKTCDNESLILTVMKAGVRLCALCYEKMIVNNIDTHIDNTYDYYDEGAQDWVYDKAGHYSALEVRSDARYSAFNNELISSVPDKRAYDSDEEDEVDAYNWAQYEKRESIRDQLNKLL